MLYTILSILAFLAILTAVFSLSFAFGVVAMMVLFEQLKGGYELQL